MEVADIRMILEIVKKCVCLSFFLSSRKNQQEMSGLVAEAKDFTVLQSVQNVFRIYPASYSSDTGD